MNLQDQENSVHNELIGQNDSSADNKKKEEIGTSGESNPLIADASDTILQKPEGEKKKQVRQKAAKKSAGSAEDTISKSPDTERVETTEQQIANSPEEVGNSDDVSDQLPEGNIDASVKDINQNTGELINFSLLNKAELIAYLEELVSTKPVQEIRRDVENIKVNFYKKHRAEIDGKRKKFM